MVYRKLAFENPFCMKKIFIPVGLVLSVFSSLNVHAQCDIKTTSDASTCVGQTTTISASGNPGVTVKWYDQPTGGTLLSTGNTFTVTSPTTSVTYYAEGYSGGGVTKDSINTLNPNNGQSGAFFDVKPKKDMTITGINFVPRSSTTYKVSVYWKSGTFVGSETNSGAWTLLGTSSSFSTSANVLTPVPLNLSKKLTANQKSAFYVIAVAGSSLGYTNGSSVGQLAVSNSDIEVYQGKGSGGLFSSSLFTTRTWSGTLKYEIGSECISTRVPVSVTVNDYTKIESQTLADTSCITFDAQLSVKSKGAITQYQWQIWDNANNMFVDIMGNPPFFPNNDKLDIINIPDTLDGSIYRVIVKGMCGDDTSKQISLKVDAVPAIVTDPQDITIQQFDDAIFEVKTAGVGVQYQWQVSPPNKDSFANINNGPIYTGVRTNRLQVHSATRAQDGYRFRCEIKGVGDCATAPDTSEFGILYVQPTASVGSLSGDDNNIAVYPNPSAGSELVVRVDGKNVYRQLHYTMTDKLGRVLLRGEIAGTNTSRLDISTLPAGVYIIQFIDADNKPVQATRFTKL